VRVCLRCLHDAVARLTPLIHQSGEEVQVGVVEVLLPPVFPLLPRIPRLRARRHLGALVIVAVAPGTSGRRAATTRTAATTSSSTGSTTHREYSGGGQRKQRQQHEHYGATSHECSS
jgi:hypothetical protein